MLVQDYLRSDRSLDQLRENFGIRSVRGIVHPHLVSLSYDQRVSPMSEPLVRQCRGVVLDESSGWSVAARGFDKFFNLGEQHADAIDWSSAVVEEKIDGSLMLLYSHRGAPLVATSGNPEAAGPVGESETTFAELFWSVYDAQFAPAPGETWIFELATPANRVIVPHEESRLYLLGIRTSRGLVGAEQLDEVAEAVGVRRPVRFPLSTPVECRQAAATLDPLRMEGFVVRDRLDNRVKVKSPRYVALHQLKDRISSSNLLEYARSGEDLGEVAVHFPDIAARVLDVRSSLDALARNTTAVLTETLEAGPDRKAMAAVANRAVWPAAVFAMLDGHVQTAADFITTSTLPGLERAVERIRAVTSHDGRADGDALLAPESSAPAGTISAAGTDKAAGSRKYVGVVGLDGTHEVYIVDGSGRRPLDLRRDLRDHSTEPAWGYGGSGPSQLALALVADACGDRVANRVYQDFKRVTVAPLDGDRGWSLDVESVRRTVAQLARERELVR